MSARQHAGTLRIAITGGTGYVGRFIVDAALAAGHQVTILGRRPWPHDSASVRHIPWSLGEATDLAGHDALVHAAFKHQPGLYRGGEGDDPAGFRRDNLDGTIRLFNSAAVAGVRTGLFMSSRAVFDGYPAGTPLTENLSTQPTSLYGRVKAEAEQALATLAGPAFRTISLRSTGVYGPFRQGEPHKWAGLFKAFFAGQPVAPRIGTEVHGSDLARAVLLLLNSLEHEHLSAAGKSLPGDSPAHSLPSLLTPDLSSISQANALTGPDARAKRPRDRSATELATDPHPSIMRSDSCLPDDAAGAARSTDCRQSQEADGGRTISHTSDQTDRSTPAQFRRFARGASSKSQKAALSSPWHKNVHISDIILDRRTLLDHASRILPHANGICLLSPESQDPNTVRILDCRSLAELGWRGGGYQILDATIASYGRNDNS